MNEDRPYYRPAGHPNVRPVMASLHNRPGWMLIKAEDIGTISPLTDEDMPRLMAMFKSIAEMPAVPFP